MLEAQNNSGAWFLERSKSAGFGLFLPIWAPRAPPEGVGPPKSDICDVTWEANDLSKQKNWLKKINDPWVWYYLPYCVKGGSNFGYKTC